MDTRDRKDAFYVALSEYLTTNIGHKSILLQMGKPEGVQWADTFNAIPGVHGGDTAEFVAAALREWLG